MTVHASIQSFNLALGKYATDTVPDLLRGRMTIIALEGAKSLTELTPVDYGRAKGNWQTSLGSPAGGELERFDKTEEGTPGRVAMADVLPTMRNWKPGVWIWYHNGVPYITILNDGTGGRTAHMMLERTVEHLTRWIES